MNTFVSGMAFHNMYFQCEYQAGPQHSHASEWAFVWRKVGYILAFVFPIDFMLPLTIEVLNTLMHFRETMELLVIILYCFVASIVIACVPEKMSG